MSASLQPTPNQLSIDGLQNNALLNGLNSPDKIPFTWELTNYNTIDMLMYVKGKKSRSVNGVGGFVQKPIIGVSRVIQQVATAVVVGSNLVVTFTDPTYDKFRLKQVTLDGTPAKNSGRVISSSAGTVTLEPSPSIVAVGGWNPTIHYPVGTYILAAYDNSGFQDSLGTQPLYNVPYYVTDAVATMRESLPLKISDFFATYAKWKDSPYWANGQEMFMYQNFNRGKINRDYFGDGAGSFNSGIEGTVNYTLGFRKAIMDQYRGGYYQSYTSVLTQTQWDNWLTTVADLQAIASGGETMLTLLMGREFLKTIQGFTAPYVQFSGIRNTFGGAEVKGLNVYDYAYGGVVAKLIIDPVLNDIPSYPTGSSIAGVTGTITQNTCMALDFGDYPSPDGGGMLPAIEDLYWDMAGASTIFAYEPGLLGGGAGKNGFFNSGTNIAVGASPTQKLHLFEMSGKSIMASRCGWIEPAY